MAFDLPIRWRRITRGSAALRNVFLIPKISHIICHCKFVSQGACIFLKKKLKTTCEVGKTRRRKNLSLNRVFRSWTITSEKCTRAHVQENKSIFLSIYLSVWKPFWKRVCVYIYIYIYTTIFLKVNCFIHRLKVFRSGELLVSSAESSRWK